MRRFTVQRDSTQWIPFWNWTYTTPDGVSHGLYPFRWAAWLAGSLHTR